MNRAVLLGRIGLFGTRFWYECFLSMCHPYQTLQTGNCRLRGGVARIWCAEPEEGHETKQK